MNLQTSQPELFVMSDSLVSAAAAPKFYKCSFQCCKQRSWFVGFQTLPELEKHMNFHKCQWIFPIIPTRSPTLPAAAPTGLPVMVNVFPNASRTSYVQCDYIPKDEKDLLDHIENDHISNNLKQSRHIPSKIFNNRSKYFCPWQTCTSIAYAQKGTENRAHIIAHVKKHVSAGTNDYNSVARKYKSPGGGSEELGEYDNVSEEQHEYLYRQGRPIELSKIYTDAAHPFSQYHQQQLTSMSSAGPLDSAISMDVSSASISATSGPATGKTRMEISNLLSPHDDMSDSEGYSFNVRETHNSSPKANFEASTEAMKSVVLSALLDMRKK